MTTLKTEAPQFTNQDFELMEQALTEAKTAAENGEVPAGAVVASPEGLVLGRGRNQVIAKNDPSAHAEILAIRQAAETTGNYRLTGLYLYSTLEPCPMCLMAAIHARLAGLYFGAPEPKWGAAGSLLNLPGLPGLNHRLTVKAGLRADESRSLIVDFFKERRKKNS